MNLSLPEYGGVIHKYSSQYHHESRCLNLQERDGTLVWFSHSLEPLPQYVIIKLEKLQRIQRVGFFIHGENNQNPKHIMISTSTDDIKYETVIDEELEWKAGEYIYNVNIDALYVKFTITENFGGSGVYISKLFIF